MSISQTRLAVCTWSLQPKSPQELLAALSEIGLSRVQLALNPILEGGDWTDGGKALTDAGITLISGMLETVDEDYSTLDRIKETGGVVPDTTWPKSWENIQKMAPIAQSLGLKLVTLHAGFLPEEESNPAYDKLHDRIIQIADLYADHGIDIGFETGQEDAQTLKAFLEKLDKPSVGVNFDPANMILYDKGDPILALATLAPFIKQCHIKDATRTKTPGEWGAEVTTGQGEVDWKGFFKTLEEINYTGNLAIEREAGEQRIADIKTAKEYVLNL